MTPRQKRVAQVYKDLDSLRASIRALTVELDALVELAMPLIGDRQPDPCPHCGSRDFYQAGCPICIKCGQAPSRIARGCKCASCRAAAGRSNKKITSINAGHFFATVDREGKRLEEQEVAEVGDKPLELE